MPRKKPLEGLSRRERQIMEVIYALGEATVNEVYERIPDAPSYSAVRGIIRILVEKEQLRWRREGPRYVFTPVQSRGAASRAAVKEVLETFFNGSAADTFAALLDVSGKEIPPQELARLEAMIEAAKREGR